MNPAQRCMKFLQHIAEGGEQRGTSPDQHIIVAGAHRIARGGGQSHDLP
jgi:hypothetical protein